MEAISMEAVGEVNRPAQLSVQTVVLDTTKSRDRTGRWSRDKGKFIFTNLPESKAESQYRGVKNIWH